MMVLDRGIVSIAKDSIHLSNRRGVASWNILQVILNRRTNMYQRETIDERVADRIFLLKQILLLLGTRVHRTCIQWLSWETQRL